MASSKGNNNRQKSAHKAIKKNHRGIVVIGTLFFLFGFLAGYIGAEYLGKSDCFVLNGEERITVSLGEAYTYTEQGATVISFGRDLSSQVTIQTDLPIDANEGCIIDTSKEATYTIIYTIDDIQYGSVKRIRTITVLGGNF